MDTLRTVIADDSRPFREGLARLLGLIPVVELVGQAVDGEDAVRKAHALQPDVILMDLQMPGMNGIEATARILAASPQIGVIVLTMSEDDESVFAAMRAGARGYLLKGSDRAEISRAVTAVGSGEALFSPAIAQRLLQYFTAVRTSTAERAFPELTAREREVLQLISEGLTNADIGNRLHLAPKTVRNHVSSVFTKLGVADRAQAVIRAREAGLGTPDRLGRS